MVPKRDLVRVVDQFVRSLPESIIEEPLEERQGRPSYHPRVMLKVLLYAYTQKLYSCRKIAKALRQSVFFMWLAGMEQPGFKAINDFRRNDLGKDLLEKVFGQLAEFLLKQDYVKGEEYFVDGTLLEADARKYSAVWRKNTERYSEAVRKRAREIMAEAEAVNQAEDEIYGERDLEETGEGSELTAEEIEKAARQIGRELEEASRARREVAEREKKEKKQRRKKKKHQAQRLLEEAEKLRKYEEQEKKLEKRNSYSKTDPDATFMRMKNGELRAGYNIQLGTEEGFILGYSVSQNPNDGSVLKAHLEARDRQGLPEKPKRLIADAGYGTEENYDVLREKQIEAYVKYPAWHREISGKSRPFEKASFEYDESTDRFVCPAGRHLVRIGERDLERKSGYVTQEVEYASPDCSGCSFKEACTRTEGNRTLRHSHKLAAYQAEARERLVSEEGAKLRKRRGWEVETQFAVLKKNLAYTRMRLRGLAKATVEVGCLALAMNLIRLSQLQAATNG